MNGSYYHIKNISKLYMRVILIIVILAIYIYRLIIALKIKYNKYLKTRKASKFVYLNKPKKLHKNNKIAIIVPYRDNQLQNRKEHLRLFLNYFKSYLV